MKVPKEATCKAHIPKADQFLEKNFTRLERDEDGKVVEDDGTENDEEPADNPGSNLRNIDVKDDEENGKKVIDDTVNKDKMSDGVDEIADKDEVKDDRKNDQANKDKDGTELDQFQKKDNNEWIYREEKNRIKK